MTDGEREYLEENWRGKEIWFQYYASDSLTIDYFKELKGTQTRYWYLVTRIRQGIDRWWEHIFNDEDVDGDDDFHRVFDKSWNQIIEDRQQEQVWSPKAVPNENTLTRTSVCASVEMKENFDCNVNNHLYDDDDHHISHNIDTF